MTAPSWYQRKLALSRSRYRILRDEARCTPEDASVRCSNVALFCGALRAVGIDPEQRCPELLTRGRAHNGAAMRQNPSDIERRERYHDLCRRGMASTEATWWATGKARYAEALRKLEAGDGQGA